MQYLTVTYHELSRQSSLSFMQDETLCCLCRVYIIHAMLYA